MAVPEPITRLEKYWAAILDKIDSGGGGSDPEWRSFTVTGTLAAPFAFEDYLSLDMADKIYVTMEIDATAIGADNVTVNLDYIGSFAADPSRIIVHFSACNIPNTTVSDATAAAVVILVDNDSVRFVAAMTMQQGAIVDVSQYASLMPTTTTFVYHIPSSND